VFRPWSVVLSLLTWKIGGFGFPFGVLLVFSVLGAVFAWGTKFVPMYLFVILYPLTIILTHVEARYRVPMVPVLSILAVLGGREIYRRIRDGQGASLFAAVGLGAVVLLISTVPGPFVEEKLNYKAEMYHLVAGYYQEHNQPEEGVKFCAQALAMDPNSADANLIMGLLQEARNQPDEAIAYYRRTISLAPDYEEPYFNLAVILQRKGEYDEATELLRTAVTLRPDLAVYHHNLGVLLLLKRRPVEAIDEFRQALAIRRKYPMAHFNLGNALVAVGRLEEAKYHYREALRLDPTNRGARQNLEILLRR